MKIQIAHLYPSEMNIYGDTGNRLILQKRLEWRGIDVSTHLVHPGQPIPKTVDIIIGGGGQDKGQTIVEKDLQTKKTELLEMRDSGVVMLMICGMYQLFGHRFITAEDQTIQGIGVLDIETIAKSKRLIGNINVRSEWGLLVGYENHSGQTSLGPNSTPLGIVEKGWGNNDHDKEEGARSVNVFGSYLHGPILAKNHQFADALIDLALQRHDTSLADFPGLDDELTKLAHDIAARRPH